MAEEYELKLEAPAHYQVPDLAGIQDGLSASEPVEERITTTYWDTPDLRLARWGIILRHRAGAGWTVKLGAAERGSRAHQAQRFPGGATHPPDAAVDLVRAYVRAAELRAVATMRTRRRAVTVIDAEGVEQVGVVDDEVSVLDGRRIALRFREVEVDVKASTANGLVERVVGRLRAAGATPVELVPKHVRAMGPRSQAPPEVQPGPVHPGSSAGEVLQAATAAAVTRLLRNDPLIRLGGDPESVHQARVATRRLRSDLRTFKPVLDAEWADSLRDDLEWLADLLGDLRDADILALRVGASLRTVAGGDSRRLSQKLTSRRRAARARLLTAMRSERYIDLLQRLVGAAEDPRLAEAAAQPAAEVLPPLARRTWTRLRHAVQRLDKAPADEQLHAVRIAAKGARYAAEAVAPVVGKPARRFAGAVADLQQTLGDYNDSVVTTAWLRDAVANMEPATAFMAGALSEKEQGTARSSKAAWPAAWKKLSRKRMHQWMDA